MQYLKNLVSFAFTTVLFTSLAEAQSWQPLTNTLPVNARVQSIAGDGSRLFIGVGLPQGGVGIYYSTDNGDSWTKTSVGPNTNTPIYADNNALLVNPNVVLASRLVTQGELFRSVDNGASWQNATGIAANGGVTGFAQDGTNYYAQVYSYGPYRSTDHGATWTPAYTGVTGIPQNIGVLNGRVFSAQIAGGLFASSDQGGTWTKIQPELVGSNFPSCRMAVQGNKIFMGVSGGAAPSVISVADGSGTWQAADGRLPSTFNEKDITANSNAVFIGGQYGSAPSIWQTMDAGVTWQELSAAGLNNAPSSITPVSCVWAQNNYLYASTIAINGTNGFYRLALNNGIYNQAPTIVTNPVSQTSMVGLSVTFNVAAIGQGPFFYQWRSNGVNIAGATASTLQLDNLTTNFAASYSALVWNAYGTNTSTNAVLSVLPASPGNPDFSFNPGPMGYDTSGYVIGGAVNAVAVQPDGKILAAGSFNRVGGVMGVSLATGGTVCSNIARFLPSGALDASFLLPNGSIGDIKALALQADGKILVGGLFTNYAGIPRGRIARLNTNGTLDTSFLASASGFNKDVNAIVVQNDGKIVVGGDFTSVNGTNRSYLARLLPNGDYDTNYLNGLSGPSSTVLALAKISNSVYAAGSFSTFNGTTRGRIARVLDTGALDTAFNSTNGFSGDVTAFTVQPDGKLVCVGVFSSYRGTNCTRIARINSDGTFDFGYGTGLNSFPYSAVAQSDGKVLVGGNFLTANSTNRVRIARFNSDGSVDTSFDPGTGANNVINAMALQSDGQLIIGGFFSTYNGQNRYLLTRVLAAPLATPPPVLQYVQNAGNFQFIWSGSYILQSNSLLQSTGWVTIPGASPLSVPVLNNGNVFFRLAPAP